MSRNDITTRLDNAKKRLELAEVNMRLDRIKMAKKASKAAMSAYRAAERNRTTRDWRSPNVSADAAIISDSPVMNARARQMVRDDSYAQSIVRAFRRNVVGTGINPSFQAMNPGGKPLDMYNRMADIRWHDWSTRPDLVDIEGKRTFHDIQRWVISELVTVGEAFVISRYLESRGDDSGLVLQCVESDQLDTTTLRHGDNEVRGGIEVDQWGKAIAYHFWTRHPNDYAGGVGGGNWHNPDRLGDTWDTREPYEKGNTSGDYTTRTVRIEAKHVMHIFEPDRSRQARGVSRLHSVLTRLRDLGQFEYAELLKAKAQACLGLVITSDLGGTDYLGLAGPAGEGNPRVDADGNDEFAMQPIMTARLAPGENVQPFAPTSPGGQFTPFMMQELKAIAAGVGLSYEQVARDFTNGTYSSQRQSFLEDRREFVPLQNLLAAQLCQPVARQFVEWSILEGSLVNVAPMAMLTYIDWRGQGWDWVDPKNEAEANESALAQGLDTKQRVLALKGLDWREVATQRHAEVMFEESLKAASAPTVPAGEISQPQTKVEAA